MAVVEAAPDDTDDVQCPVTDQELLAIVADERRRSIGFDHDDELRANRELALNYAKGDMSDIPALPNRSKAVATPVADAVETILPDLAEIFLKGDDVVSFQPVGQEDEDGAQQETDYIKHVLFQKNPGFLNLYSMFRDALLLKAGVGAFWWEGGEKEESEDFEGKTAVELSMAQQAGDVTNVRQSEIQGPEPLYDFTVTQRKNYGCAKWMAVPAEDFTVSADTVRLEDAPYSAMRSRPRVFQLIAEGHPRDKVEALPAYGTQTDQSVDQARDQAGEHERSQNLGGKGDYRQVEIVTHLIRVLNDNDELELWKVVTGGSETVLLSKEKLNRVGFAALTPYLEPHRFYGRSVYDLLGEIQRIQTALTRMALDSGYFALNQRHEVAMDQATANTLSDLLDNRPGLPVRTKNGQAVRPLTSPGLSFDAFGALEYFSTKAEERSGIVRNAQGLKPDTLHDTATGAMALIAAAQKRVRMIARIFAETGIKDLYLGIHALIRENATEADVVRLRGKWVPVDPTSWGERSDMIIEVGLGAGGQDHDLQMLTMQMDGVEKLVAGGFSSVFTQQNAYNLAKRLFEKTGAKQPDQFVTDPGPPQPQQPQMHPEVQKAMIQAQADQQAQAQKAQMDQQRMQADFELRSQKQQQDADLRYQQLQAEISLKLHQIQAEIGLKAGQIHAEAALDAADMAHRHHMAEVAITSDVRPGGEPG